MGPGHKGHILRVPQELQGPLVRAAAQLVEDEGFQAAQLVLPGLQGQSQRHALREDPTLLVADRLHLHRQVGDLVHLALAAVLGGDFVFAPPADVAACVDLLLGEVVAAGQHAVELVHGAVDDAVGREGDPLLQDDFVVAGFATAAASPAPAAARALGNGAWNNVINCNAM